MTEPSPREMIRRVRGRTLDCRTGILLLPLEQLGQEAAVAARFNTDAVDFVRLKAEMIPPDAVFMRLDKQTLVSDLDALCEGSSYVASGDTDCFFVYNFDLPLAALDAAERQAVWRFLRDGFRKRRKAVLFALPETATSLLPTEAEAQGWRQGGRWAVLPPSAPREGQA